jgi:hypothetical protein
MYGSGVGGLPVPQPAARGSQIELNLGQGKGQGFRFEGSGFEVQGPGFGVWGLVSVSSSCCYTSLSEKPNRVQERVIRLQFHGLDNLSRALILDAYLYLWMHLCAVCVSK